MTIPRALADKKRIRPGDSVIFEETDDAIIIKKASGPVENYERVKKAIEEFSKDVPKIRKRLKESESALVENLSRHVSP